jgi:hypothetical protein
MTLKTTEQTQEEQNAANKGMSLYPHSRIINFLESTMEEVLPVYGSININGIGEYNGQNILDMDLDEEGAEKLWRQPGMFDVPFLTFQSSFFPITRLLILKLSSLLAHQPLPK